jgi:hypothetical protein
MEYQDLYNEYSLLLKNKNDCQNRLTVLKDGYISNKTISGKKYAYLQCRINGKLSSEYIREDCLSGIQAELSERAQILDKIREINSRLLKIENAADILNRDLHRRLVTLRRCAIMETLPFGERTKSLAFGNAMTALEGIPASKETEKNLLRWANGDMSFQESFMNTLRAYHLSEV